MLMSEQRQDTQTLTDYDPEPVVLEEPSADEAGVNITLDEGTEEDPERSWFFIHCYSGYEKKVEHALRQRIETMGMQDQIYDVLIPTEDEIEVKDGKRRTVEKRVFPGYVMVQMHWDRDEGELDKDAWYTVRNTPGVVGFVGGDSQPTPLRPEEVKRIMDRMDSEDTVVKVDYKIGERVRIVGGPFNDFPGTVATIDSGREKVRVMVDFFGRETAVVLSFMEVERM
jgi:transcriptional antiterminator NusG